MPAVIIACFLVFFWDGDAYCSSSPHHCDDVTAFLVMDVILRYTAQLEPSPLLTILCYS